MDLVEIGKAISNAGGWTAFVILVVVIAVVAWRAFKSGTIVAGFVYQAALAERDAWMQRSLEADQRVDRLSDNFEAALKVKT